MEARRRQIQRGLLVEVPGARYPRFWETCSASLLGVPNSSLIYDWHSLPFFERGGRERARERMRERRARSTRERPVRMPSGLPVLTTAATFLRARSLRSPLFYGDKKKSAFSSSSSFFSVHCAIINGPVRSERIRSPSI